MNKYIKIHGDSKSGALLHNKTNFAWRHINSNNEFLRHCQTFHWYTWLIYRIATTVLLVKTNSQTKLNIENVPKKNMRWNDMEWNFWEQKKCIVVNNWLSITWSITKTSKNKNSPKKATNIVYWFLYQDW